MIRDELVHLFMSKAGEVIEIQKPTIYPHMQPSQETMNLGWRLIKEECYSEMKHAMAKCERSYSTHNVAELLDCMCDGIYVMLWLAHKLGLPIVEAFEIVAEANLKKVRDGFVVDEGGKIQKPEGWIAPNAELEQLVMNTFWRSQLDWNSARPMNAPRMEDAAFVGAGKSVEDMLVKKGDKSASS